MDGSFQTDICLPRKTSLHRVLLAGCELRFPPSSLWTKCHQALRCAPALTRGEFSARVHRGRSASPRARNACLRPALRLRYSASATSRVASGLAPCHDGSSRRNSLAHFLHRLLASGVPQVSWAIEECYSSNPSPALPEACSASLEDLISCSSIDRCQPGRS